MGEIIAMFCCIALNAVLSFTEMAFVSVGKNRLRELARDGDRNAERLVKLRDNPERTLSVLQIGITLLGAVAAATGGVGIEESLSPYLQRLLGIRESASEVLGIILIVVPLTYLSVVVGELVPKTLALRNPVRVALKSAKWLIIADKAFMPVINVLEWSTKKLLAVIAPRSKSETHDTGDSGLNIELLSPPHRQYVLNLVNIEMKRIRDVFVPMKDVTFIAIDCTMEQIHEILIESAYTRLPVFQNGQLIGIVHSKEFMALRASGKTDWREILRQAPMVQPQESLLRVLRVIQDGRSQMAIVKQGNEFLGIVSLEDIIEEIIGDVFDEDEDDAIKRLLSTGSTMRTPHGQI